jgi:hypothetical protein
MHYTGKKAKAKTKPNSPNITHGKWKLINWPTSGGFMGPSYIKPLPGEPEGQLYDIINDPGETQNLWKQYPKVVETLLRLLKKQTNHKL